jgi:hypothetical protein
MALAAVAGDWEARGGPFDVDGPYDGVTLPQALARTALARVREQEVTPAAAALESAGRALMATAAAIRAAAPGQRDGPLPADAAARIIAGGGDGPAVVELMLTGGRAWLAPLGTRPGQSEAWLEVALHA